jgi:Zn-dependent protease/CBS domain-containing protein
MHAFRLGKLFGIDIRIDASWLVIFVLLTWNLSTAFSGLHADWPPVESFAVALAASLVFFGCILFHELAHSLVARRYNLRVRSITLFLFGGVSNIEQEPSSPRAELLTAIAGPAASVALGVGFFALALAFTAVSLEDAPTAWNGLARLGPVVTLFAWLGPVNIGIGVFNLIPAFPLDGGRVLRSIFWGISGDLRLSTRRVASLGQVFGWLFILMGIAMTFGAHVVFFGTGLASGLWLALIGWFLHTAATQSYRRLAIDDALAGHTVAEVMRRDGAVVPPDLSLADLVHDSLIPLDERALPVVRDGKLLGLVCLSEVRRVPREAWSSTRVDQVMRPGDVLAVATPNEPLADAFARLAQNDIGQLPVLDGERLVGMLNRRDVGRRLELAWGRIAGEDRPRRRHNPPAPTAAPSSPHGPREPHARSI